MEKKNRRTLVVSILAVLFLIILTVGTTYAIFTYVGKGQTDNIIKTGEISFLYTENGNNGNGISITNAFPISDIDGKKQFGDYRVFEFSITGKTSSNADISYELTARKITDNSDLPDNFVKLYLTDYNGIEEVPIASTYDDGKSRVLTYADLKKSKYEKTDSEKTLYNGIIPRNTNNYEKIFRLRMWLNDEIDLSPDSDSTTGTSKYSNMSFSIKVNAYAGDSIISPDSKKMNAAYKIGDRVTLLNGKSYHVIKNSPENSDVVYLFDDINVNEMPFDTLNSNVYDETTSTNVGYYIRYSLYSIIRDSLISNGGSDEELEVTLLTKDDIDGIINANIENSSWLYSTNYFIKSPSVDLIYVVRDNALTTVVPNSSSGVRVVVKTRKVNIDSL